MMILPKPPKAYLTLPEAAERIGMSTYKLRKSMKDGLIKAKRLTDKPHSRFVFTEQSIAEYESCCMSKRRPLWYQLKVWIRKCML